LAFCDGVMIALLLFGADSRDVSCSFSISLVHIIGDIIRLNEPCILIFFGRVCIVKEASTWVCCYLVYSAQ
jgi:hypothetical protein